MNYGFVIDNSSCIGCHACSTACKSENQVPVGVHRTWVKYVEAGQYPDVRRTFQVSRCNHCSNPPCVRICPTQAMFQRTDGIVEFDGDACIGCKACMQACPYDAIYLDPETHTAAKCHYCSHRVDVGLEPACVVVCPEHAIIAGDLDDPSSEISRVIAKNNVTVRKPDQGTAPKVFYIEGNDLALHPTVRGRPEQLLFSEVDHHHTIGHIGPEAAPDRVGSTNSRGMPVRVPENQGAPSGGPLQVGGRMAEHMVQVAWNAQHKVQWHWPIPTYIITKHIAAGTFGLFAVMALLPWLTFQQGALLLAGIPAMLLTHATLALLLYDLDRPDRFFYLLVRPQWRSWVARAAWILTGFAIVTHAWWAVEGAAWMGLVPQSLAEMLRPALAVLTIPFAILASIYTAFLFGQAEGRDYWQSPHIAPLMAAQGLMLGAMAVAAVTSDASMIVLAGVSTVVSFGLTVFGDLGTSLPSELARRAAEDITHGRYRKLFLTGLLLGHVVPLGLLFVPGGALPALIAAAVGLGAYAYAFVMAPQDIPNS